MAHLELVQQLGADGEQVAAGQLKALLLVAEAEEEGSGIAHCLRAGHTKQEERPPEGQKWAREDDKGAITWGACDGVCVCVCVCDGVCACDGVCERESV